MANDNYNSSPFTPQYTLIQKIKELQDHVKTIYENEEQFNQRIAELESKSIQFITLENVDLTADGSVEIDFSAADYGKASGVKNCKLFIICSHGPSEYGARPVIFELSKFKQDLSLNEISFSGNVFSVSSDDKYVDTIFAVATLSLGKIRIKFARVSLNFQLDFNEIPHFNSTSEITGDVIGKIFRCDFNGNEYICYPITKFDVLDYEYIGFNSSAEPLSNTKIINFDIYYEDGNGITIDTMDNTTLDELIGAIPTKKLDFGSLTHSFNELTTPVKNLVDSAITAGNTGVSCTGAQWGLIKELLDKSLYLSYNDYKIIKTLVYYNDNNFSYHFGTKEGFSYGYFMDITYDGHNNKLYITHFEI